jgi:CRP/FNR family cyclic AMP-dependent transcriptional regulator
MLGIGRESAARALLDYQQEGLISLQNRMITIHDLKVLRQRAGQQHETIESRKWHSQHKYDTTSL